MSTQLEFTTFLEKMRKDGHVTQQVCSDLITASEKFMRNESNRTARFVIEDNDDHYPSDSKRLKIRVSSYSKIIDEYYYWDGDESVDEKIAGLKAYYGFTNPLHTIIFDTDYFED